MVSNIHSRLIHNDVWGTENKEQQMKNLKYLSLHLKEANNTGFKSKYIMGIVHEVLSYIVFGAFIYGIYLALIIF